MGCVRRYLSACLFICFLGCIWYLCTQYNSCHETHNEWIYKYPYIIIYRICRYYYYSYHHFYLDCTRSVLVLCTMAHVTFSKCSVVERKECSFFSIFQMYEPLAKGKACRPGHKSAHARTFINAGQNGVWHGLEHANTGIHFSMMYYHIIYRYICTYASRQAWHRTTWDISRGDGGQQFCLQQCVSLIWTHVFSGPNRMWCHIGCVGVASTYTDTYYMHIMYINNNEDNSKWCIVFWLAHIER